MSTPNPHPSDAYKALARQHPELMVECWCRGEPLYRGWPEPAGYLELDLEETLASARITCPDCGETGRRPRDLGELLELLEEAGIAGVDLHFTPPSASIHRYGRHAATERELALLVQLHEARPASLEEAAARLWCAVTGRAVTA